MTSSEPTSADHGPHRRPPDRLGPCRLLAPLGAGAAGTVFAAELERDQDYAPAGARVAVKVLDPQRISAENLLERFHREAELGRQVNHACVVRTFAVGCAVEHSVEFHYLVLEYVEGRTLRTLLTELGVLPEALLRDIARQLAAGLGAIHAVGAAHRDLKPGNVLITADYQVKLMDLGVAHLIESGSRLTQDGFFVGTLLYAAPEQIRGEAVGPAADLYSLGALLYESATGLQPFDGGSQSATIRRHLHHVPPKASELNPQLTPWFEDVLACLLEKNQEDRFASAAELAEVLAAGEASRWWQERQRDRTVGSAVERRSRLAVDRDIPFVGRVRELQTLRTLFRDARAGRGRAVLVEGEAGVGKTRLLDEFVGRLLAEEEDLILLYGRGSREMAAGAFEQALLQHFGERAVRSKLEVHLSATPPVVPHFLSWLKGERPTEPGGLAIERVAEVVVYLASLLAGELPLLWIADDLGEGPASDLALFSALAAACGEHRCLLVGAARRGRAVLPAAGTTPCKVQHLPLGRLSQRQMNELLGDLLDPHLAAATVGRDLGQRAAGNPLFLAEMLRELRRRRLIEDVEATEVVGFALGVDQRPPAALRGLLRERLAQLPSELEGLLAVAAVAGQSFDARLVARVAGRHALEALETLALAERQHGVVRAKGERFVFDHPELRAEIERGLEAGERRRLHGELARLAEVERAERGEAAPVTGEEAVFLARHWLSGGAPERAFVYLVAALDHLAGTPRGDELVELANDGLSARPEPSLRAEVRLREAACLELKGRYLKQRAAAEDAVVAARASGDGRALARAQLALARARIATGDHNNARRLLEAVLAAAQTLGDRNLEARALGNLGRAAARSGVPAMARDYFLRQLGLARELGDPRLESLAHLRLGREAVTLGRYAAAREALELAATAFERLSLLPEQARTFLTLGVCHAELGRFSDAADQLDKSLTAARACGATESALRALVELGWVRLEEGDLETAERLAKSALTGARERQMRAVEIDGLLCLGETSRRRGHRDEAERRFGEALELGHAAADSRAIARAAFAQGRLLLERGDRHASQSLLEEAATLARDLELAVPGSLPRRYLAFFDGVPPAPVPTEEPVLQRAEGLLLLFRAARRPEVLGAALELLASVEAGMDEGTRDRFWAVHPVARTARKYGERQSSSADGTRA